MPAVRPIDYPPPFDSAEVIGPPTDPEDERIEVGIAIVGGGPAGLACANKVMQLLEDEPELTEKLGEVPVAVIHARDALSEEQLRTFLESRIAKFKIPARFIFSDEPLPRLGTGKIDRRALKAQYAR